MQRDVNCGAMTRKGFVNGIIDNFPEAVHQASAIIGPDVHTWPLANGIKTFKYRKVFC